MFDKAWELGLGQTQKQKKAKNNFSPSTTHTPTPNNALFNEENIKMPRPQRPRRRPAADAPISTSTPTKLRSSALDQDPMLLVSPPVMSSTPAHVPAPPGSTRALRDISNSPTKKQQLQMRGDDVLLKSPVKTTRHNHNVLITPQQPDKERVDIGEEDQINEEESGKDDEDTEKNAIGAGERNKYAPIRRARQPRSFPSTTTATRSDLAPTSTTTLNKTATTAVRIDPQFQLGSDDDPFGFKQVDQSNIIPSFAPQAVAVVVPAQDKSAFGGVMSSPISGLSSSPAPSSTPARFGEPVEFEEPIRLDSDQSGPDSVRPFSEDADSAADKEDASHTNDNADKTASVTVVSVSKLRFPRNGRPRSTQSSYQPPSTDELLSILPARKYVPPAGASKPRHSDDDNDEDENGDLFSSEEENSEEDEEDDDDVEYGSRPRSARLKRRRGRAPASRGRSATKKSKPAAVSTASATIDAAAEESNDEGEPSLILPQDDDTLDAYTEQMKAKFAEIDKWELVVETVSSEESLGL